MRNRLGCETPCCKRTDVRTSPRGLRTIGTNSPQERPCVIKKSDPPTALQWGAAFPGGWELSRRPEKGPQTIRCAGDARKIISLNPVLPMGCALAGVRMGLTAAGEVRRSQRNFSPKGIGEETSREVAGCVHGSLLCTQFPSAE